MNSTKSESTTDLPKDWSVTPVIVAVGKSVGERVRRRMAERGLPELPRDAVERTLADYVMHVVGPRLDEGSLQDGDEVELQDEYGANLGCVTVRVDSNSESTTWWLVMEDKPAEIEKMKNAS